MTRLAAGLHATRATLAGRSPQLAPDRGPREAHMEMLRRAVAAVTNKDPDLSRILERLSVAIYVTDQDGFITHFNQCCITFAGRTPVAHVDRWCVSWELYTAEGEFLPHDKCPLAVALHERRSIRGVHAIALRPDGTEVPFRPLPTPIFGNSGAVEAVVNMLLPQPSQNPIALRLSRTDPVPVRNAILRDLSPLSVTWERVSLRSGEVLVMPHTPIEHVHFLESGLASVYVGCGGDQPEVGMIGHEGMTGYPLALGIKRSPHLTMMRVPGRAIRVGAGDLDRMFSCDPTARDRILEYVSEFTTQVSETAFANARLSTEGRLARWLLMVTDRTSQHLSITHDTVACAIGARRAAVTMALHVLEGAGAICARRSQIRVLDRERLGEFTEATVPRKPRALDRQLPGELP